MATLHNQSRARLLQLGPEALDHIAEVLRDRQHPKRLDTARFVVEKILPNRTMLEAEVNVSATVRSAEDQALADQTVRRIAELLEEIRDANAGRDPLHRVQMGAEALRRPRLPEGSRIQAGAGADESPVVPTEKA